MKIKIQNYSLISNEWIDQQLKQLEVYIDTDKEMMSIYNAMCYVKKQLIPSEKLADKCYEEGSGGFDYDHHTSMAQYEKDKQYFLNSEIEII